MTKKKEAIHPPVGKLAKSDPIANAITGIDKLVADGIVSTATNVKEAMGVECDDGSQDHRVISAACTAYIYGTMYVLIELYRDLGHDDEYAVAKSLEYLNTAGAMVAKHVNPPKVEH